MEMVTVAIRLIIMSIVKSRVISSGLEANNIYPLNGCGLHFSSAVYLADSWLLSGGGGGGGGGA